jgi:hypothetical protein
MRSWRSTLVSARSGLLLESLRGTPGPDLTCATGPAAGDGLGRRGFVDPVAVAWAASRFCGPAVGRLCAGPADDPPGPVGFSDEVDAMLPVEWARRAACRVDFLSRLAGGDLESRDCGDPPGGVAVILDESSSMDAPGPRRLAAVVWAKAFAVAVAGAGRPLEVLRVAARTPPVVHHLDVGVPAPTGLLTFRLGGGTDLGAGLRYLMEARPQARLRTVVIVSDGRAPLADHDATPTQWTTWTRRTNTRCVGIATPTAGMLSQICDTVTPLTQLLSS